MYEQLSVAHSRKSIRSVFPLSVLYYISFFIFLFCFYDSYRKHTVMTHLSTLCGEFSLSFVEVGLSLLFAWEQLVDGKANKMYVCMCMCVCARIYIYKCHYFLLQYAVVKFIMGFQFLVEIQIFISTVLIHFYRWMNIINFILWNGQYYLHSIKYKIDNIYLFGLS